MSEILLTLGPQYDEVKYALRLSSYRLISEALGSRLRTFDLLQQLLKSPPRIRAAACFELNHSFLGQYPCLEKLKDDPEQDPATRRGASERLTEVMRLEKLLLPQLKDPAQLGFSPMLKPDSLGHNYEELQILLRHPSQEVRSLACVALHRYFPDRDASNCVEEKHAP